MLGFFVVTVVLLCGVVMFELIARRTKISAVLIRKCIHVGMSVLTTIITLPFGYKVMVVVGLLFAVVFLVARRVYDFRSVRDRKAESWGEVFFPLGIAVATMFSVTQTIFTASLLVLAFADTAAFVVGKRFPQSKKIIANRTIAGSGAGFVVTFTIVLLCGFSGIISLAVAIGVTLCEVMSRKGFDNFSMPVATALLLTLLS